MADPDAAKEEFEIPANPAEKLDEEANKSEKLVEAVALAGFSSDEEVVAMQVGDPDEMNDSFN